MLSASANWLAAFRKLELIPVYRIIIAGYNRSFCNNIVAADGTDDPWIVSIDDHTKTINDLDGGAEVETLNFTLQDRNGDITADMGTATGGGFVFEGAKVQLYMGEASMASTSDYLLVWQGYIDQVDSASSNTEYYFTCSDLTSKMQQVVYQKGDNGGQTSAADLKTLQGHPLDIMLDVMLNQLREPATGQAFDPSLVDIAKIQTYRDGPFAGMEFFFHLSQPVQALDFIKNQILKPLGGYMWVSQGKVTVNFFYPLAGPTAVTTLTTDQWCSIPTAEQTQMVNTVVFKFDKDDSASGSSGNFLSVNTQEYAPSVKRYGLFGEHAIDSDGMRAGLQGYLISWLVSFLIFGRYGLKNLMFDKNAAEAIIYPSILLEPGDIVGVTNSFIPDRAAGVMGITNKLFECLHKKINWNEGKIVVSMIDASYLSKFGFAEVCPDAEGNYTTVSSGDKAQFMFQSGSTGKYSNGDPGNLLG